jgi:hypothetical protein
MTVNKRHGENGNPFCRYQFAELDQFRVRQVMDFAELILELCEHNVAFQHRLESHSISAIDRLCFIDDPHPTLAKYP